jgi:hypothetical protein
MEVSGRLTRDVAGESSKNPTALARSLKMSYTRRDHQRTGPLCIAIGLALLVAAQRWPVMPVVSGMALVALGSTLALISRFGDAVRPRLLIAVHVVVYGNLYCVFLGAMCHEALTGPRLGLNWWHALDLLVSVAPLAVTARSTLSVLAGDEDATAG